uniref:Putative secreted protein n=1 Tax=Anopheles darlingi TaxID=43151 RepID=A0A2M4D9D4_ANODA
MLFVHHLYQLYATVVVIVVGILSPGTLPQRLVLQQPVGGQKQDHAESMGIVIGLRQGKLHLENEINRQLANSDVANH